MSQSLPFATHRKTATLLVAAFVLPSLGVLVARFGLPLPSPASARAAEAAGVTLPRVPTTGGGSPHQMATMRAFQEESTQPFGPSPILSRVAELPPTATQPPDYVPSPSHQEELPAAVPVFSLSSVMGSNDRSMAVINGKLCRVGDRVIEGWTVTAIDREGGRVTVTSTSGEELSLSLPPKGLRPR